MADKFEPIDNVSDPQIDAMDEDVKGFCECVRSAVEDTNRIKKMTTLQEDIDLYENQFADLPSYSDSSILERPPLMKASLYQHLFQKYEVGAKKIPKLVPEKENVPELDRAMIQSVADEVMMRGGFSETYEKDIFQKFKYEGCPVIQIGFDGDVVDFDSPALNEMYFDPAGSYLQRKTGKHGRNCKWAVREVRMDTASAHNFLRSVGREDLIGKITYGTPYTEDDNQSTVEDARDYSMHRHFVFHFGYSITDEQNPVYCVYGGGSKTLVLKETGKDYRYRLNGKPILPFDMFHFTNERYGIYSPSMIGVIKDGAEALKNALNKMLPNLARAVNPYIFLLGDTDQRTIEEMKAYNSMQEQGYTPVITASGEGVQMQSVAPNADQIWSAFERMRSVVLNEIGQRLRINFRVFEEVEQTATEFVGRETQENKQVASLNRDNKYTWEWCADFTIALLKEYGSTKDKREIIVRVAGQKSEEQFTFSVGEVLAVLTDWDGWFVAYTDIKTPMTTQERRQAVATTIARLTEFLQGMNFTTMEQAEPLIDAIYEEVVMNEQEQIITKQKLIAMAQSLIEQRGGGMAMEGGESAMIPEESEVPQDVQRERASPKLASQIFE
jgi:hypothetical protein